MYAIASYSTAKYVRNLNNFFEKMESDVENIS